MHPILSVTCQFFVHAQANFPCQASQETAPRQSVVVELPLATSGQDERRLHDRVLCGARLSNVLLQTGLDMVEAMRADPDWEAARQIRDREQKRAAFDAVKQKHQFSSVHFDALVARHAKAAGFKAASAATKCKLLPSACFAHWSSGCMASAAARASRAQAPAALGRGQKQCRHAAMGE
jgi:hypothetical protein